MKIMKETINYLVFGNIFIALCAVSLCLHTIQVFDLQFRTLFLLFIFFSTLSSYSFHSFFKSSDNNNSLRVTWIRLHRVTIIITVVVAIIVAILLLSTMTHLVIWVALLSILTFFYSAPRILATYSKFLNWIIYWKTFYLAVIWTLVTCLLPAISNDSVWTPAMTVFTIIRFLFIFQISLVFEFKDRSESKEQGLRILLNSLNEKRFNALFLIISGILLLSLGVFYAIKPGISVLTSILIPELILLLLFKETKSLKSDYWFYLVIDGLLLLPGLLMVGLASIS